MGARVELGTEGSKFEGYFSIPNDGAGPPVVVLHAWWGLDGFVENVVDQLATSGFVAVAPDLYEGRTTSNPAEAAKLRDGLDVEQTMSRISAAADFVLGREESTSNQYGLVGYSIGGGLAQTMATRDERIGAAVSYYGAFSRAKPDWDNLKAPLLMIYGDMDSRISVGEATKLQVRLRKAGHEVDMVTYPADHGFADSDRVEHYDEDAASDAFNRTVEIFRQTLR